MSIRKYLFSKWMGLISLVWLCVISFFYLKDWNPLKLHPLSLLCRQIPLFPYDIYASLITLFSKGWVEMLLLSIGVLSALGMGGFLLSFFKLKTDKGQRITLSLALGIGALSYYTFGLGLVRGYNTTGILFSGIVLGLSALWGLYLVIVSLKNIQWSHKLIWSKACFIFIFCAVMFFLFSKALKPALFYDAITYHLGVPQYYVLEGGISYIPYDSCSNFPFMAEMIYTLAILFSGFKLAQLTSVLIFLLSALLVYEFCRTFVKELNPIIPALLYLSTPAFMEASILYSNDLHLAYFTLVFVYSLFLWEKGRDPGCVLLMGVFSGMCLSTKYIALTYIPVLSIVGILILAWKESKSHITRVIGLCVLSSLIVYLPWLIKNFLYTGNPLYPAFYNFLGGNDMAIDQYKSIVAMGHQNENILTGIVLHPWILFLTNPQDAHYVVGANVSPFILIFAPCLLFVKRVSPVIKKLLLFAAICFFLWNATFTQVRFLYPAIVLLLIVSAYALNSLSKNLFAGSGIFMVAGAACYILLNMSMGFYEVNLRTATYGMDLLHETDDKFLFRHMIEGKKTVLDSVPIYNYINEHTDREAVVLIIGDAQHLYIERRHRYTYLSGTTPFEIFKNKAGNNQEIANYFKAEGITHIVFNPPELIRLQQCGAISFKEEDNIHIQNFLQSRYVTYITAYKRAFITVYLFAL